MKLFPYTLWSKPGRILWVLVIHVISSRRVLFISTIINYSRFDLQSIKKIQVLIIFLSLNIIQVRREYNVFKQSFRVSNIINGCLNIYLNLQYAFSYCVLTFALAVAMRNHNKSCFSLISSSHCRHTNLCIQSLYLFSCYSLSYVKGNGWIYQFLLPAPFFFGFFLTICFCFIRP